MVLSLGLLLGVTLSGCSDKDREGGRIIPTTELADVYVDVSRVDLAFDSLYCNAEFIPANDLNAEENGDVEPDATLIELDENGLGLIGEDEEVGSKFSLNLSFQLEGEEVGTFSKDGIVGVADENGRYIIVVDDVAPVDPVDPVGDTIPVYVNISNVQNAIGYHKVVLKDSEEVEDGEEASEATELEFDENGVSTTPVAEVKEGELAKFNIAFVQTQYSHNAFFSEDKEEVDVEIANYDVSAEGVEVTPEEGKAIVVVEELTSADQGCVTFDLSGLSNNTDAKYIGISFSDEYYVPMTVAYVELRPQGDGFAPVSVNGLVAGENASIDVTLLEDLAVDAMIAKYNNDEYTVVDGFDTIVLTDDDFELL